MFTNIVIHFHFEKAICIKWTRIGEAQLPDVNAITGDNGKSEHILIDFTCTLVIHLSYI